MLEVDQAHSSASGPTRSVFSITLLILSEKLKMLSLPWNTIFYHHTHTHTHTHTQPFYRYISPSILAVRCILFIDKNKTKTKK